MSIFGKLTRRGGSTAPAVDAGDPSQTSLSEDGPTSYTLPPSPSPPSVESVKHDASGEMTGLRVLLAPIPTPLPPSGLDSRPTQSGWRRLVSTIAYGLRLRSKKPQTSRSFSDALRAETSALAEEMARDYQRQSYGDSLWHARRLPKFWRIRKHFHHHSGGWDRCEYREWYEDCECCGQPVKEVRPEEWIRRCEVCGAYESRDKIPATQKRRFRWTGHRG